MVATEDVVALKVVDEDPAEIVVDVGTITAELLLDKAVTAPPAGAGPESVTVQVLEAPPVTVAGAH